MKLRYALACALVIVLILFSGALSNFAQDDTRRQQAHPRFGTLPPPAATCTDGKHLYVVSGPQIFQYTIPELHLHNTVELPKPDYRKDAPQ